MLFLRENAQNIVFRAKKRVLLWRLTISFGIRLIELDNNNQNRWITAFFWAIRVLAVQITPMQGLGASKRTSPTPFSLISTRNP